MSFSMLNPVKSSITISQSGARTSLLLVVVRPMILAPAARPAFIPWIESSNMTVFSGLAPNFSIPLMKHSGSGLEREKSSLVSIMFTIDGSSGWALKA